MFGPEAQKAFWLKLDDLAHEMCAMLRELEPDAAKGPSRGAVFLAETTGDLKEQREAVKRDLSSMATMCCPIGRSPSSPRIWKRRCARISANA